MPLNNLVTKVDKVNIPLLVIGLGGTGKDAVLRIKQRFFKRLKCDESTHMPPRTAYLVLDADSEGIGTDPAGLTDDDFYDLTVPNIAALLNPETRRANLESYEMSWLDPNLSPPDIRDGAAGIRQAGRLQLFRHAQDLFTNVIDAKLGIMKVDRQEPGMPFINVIICGGLGGGTGSGTFLDMAYLLKDWIGRSYAGHRLRLIGLATTPQVNIDYAAGSLDTNKRNRIKFNGFAALKELDYWMSWEEHKHSYTQTYWNDHAVAWNSAPFDLFATIDNARIDGQPIRNPYHTAMEIISDMLLNMISHELPLKAEQQDNDRGINPLRTQFTIDSFLSNVHTGMAAIKAEREYPVSYHLMAIGSSDTAALQNDTASYEGKLTLEAVLKIPVLSGNGSLVNDTVGLNAAMDHHPSMTTDDEKNEFVQKTLVIGCKNKEDYDSHSTYISPILSQTQVMALDDANAPHMDAITASFDENADVFCKSVYETQWKNFVEQAKSAICDIKIGPMAFLHFLEKSFIPTLKSSYEAWQTNADVTRKKKGEDQKQTADYWKRIRYPRRYFGFIIEHHWDKKNAEYFATVNDLYADAKDIAYCEAKERYGKLLEAEVGRYKTNLKLLMDLLISKSEELALDVERATEHRSGVINFASIKSYMDNQIEAKQGVQIADAKDEMLEQIAEKSFAMPRVEAHSNHEREALKNNLVDKLQEFLQHNFAELNLNNLDVILSVTTKGAPVPEQIDTMCNVIAPSLANAATPMLHLNQTAFDLAGTNTYQYISIPHNAQTMITGMDQYRRNHLTAEVKLSSVTDRMFWLNLRIGIPMCAYNQMVALETLYENALQTPALSMGIHLVDSQPSNELSLVGSVDKSWRRLPSPIPHQMLAVKMNERMRKNEKFLRELFESSLHNGTLLIDRQQEQFVVYSSAYQDSMGRWIRAALSDAKATVDQIVGQENVSIEDKLQMLDKQRSLADKSTISYGQFMSKVAQILGVKITPSEGSGNDEIRECDANRENIRHILCTYILERYPECVDTMKAQREAFDYITKMEDQLKEQLKARDALLIFTKEYARIIIMGSIRYVVGDFIYKNGVGQETKLFDCQRHPLRNECYEALFLMQMFEQENSLQAKHKNFLNNEKERLGGSAREFKNRDAEICDQYLDILPDKIKQWENTINFIQSSQLNEVQMNELLPIYMVLIAEGKNDLELLS